MTNETIILLGFLDRLGPLLHMRLVPIEQLRARHGISYKIEGSGELMLLKLVATTSTDVVARRRKASLQKEARMLIELAEITGDLYIGHGEIDSIAWLLRRWINGVTAVEHSSYIRSGPLSLDAKRQFVTDLCHMLKKIIRLDELGYLHGDLQPRHFITDDMGEVRLIDLELAVRKSESESGYAGALIHYVSPETARGMLEGQQNIPLDLLSEIYSFGAVAFTLYTGQPATIYEAEDDKNKDISFEQQLQAIIHGHTRSFAQANVEPFPELERVLMWCLEVDRKRRCPTFTAALRGCESILASDNFSEILTSKLEE